MTVVALNHVQLAMPPGGEDAARRFYADILDIPEIEKQPHLAKRGGCWFERGSLKIHLGVELDFRPARKAHIAFTVEGLAVLIQRLIEAGFEIIEDGSLDGYDRRYVADPFCNRIELMEAR